MRKPRLSRRTSRPKRLTLPRSQRSKPPHPRRRRRARRNKPRQMRRRLLIVPKRSRPRLRPAALRCATTIGMYTTIIWLQRRPRRVTLAPLPRVIPRLPHHRNSNSTETEKGRLRAPFLLGKLQVFSSDSKYAGWLPELGYSESYHDFQRLRFLRLRKSIVDAPKRKLMRH